MKKIMSTAILIILMAFSAITALAQDVKTPADDSSIRPGMKPKQVLVIDFNATWCGPCKIFAPAFETVAADYADQAEFLSVDVDQYPQTAQAFGISAIPTLVIIQPDGNTTTYVGLSDFLGDDLDEDSTIDDVVESISDNLGVIVLGKIAVR